MILGFEMTESRLQYGSEGSIHSPFAVMFVFSFIRNSESEPVGLVFSTHLTLPTYSAV